MAGILWTKFFWADWRSDPCLRMCSYAARGLWMDMLSIAAEHDPIGYVAVNKIGLDADGLARLTGGLTHEVETLLAELEKHAVFNRTSKAIIYNRRMVSEAKKAEIARKNGKMGGNPSLGKHLPIPSSDNQQDKWVDNGGVPPNGRFHMPEAKKPVEDTPLVETPSPTTKTETPERVVPSAKKAEAGLLKSDFDVFWASVPNKAKKKDALKAYLTARKTTDANTILEGIKRYAAEQSGNESQFIAHPATWLNGDRWLDAPQPSPPAGNGSRGPNGHNGRGAHVAAAVDSILADDRIAHEFRQGRPEQGDRPVDLETQRAARRSRLGGILLEHDPAPDGSG